MVQILMPERVVFRSDDVTKVVAESTTGSFGLLPHRQDCVMPLVPGILSMVVAGEERFVAVDEGVLVKAGPLVAIAVRLAIVGANLESMRHSVEQHLLSLDEQEQQLRQTLIRIEQDFVRMIRDRLEQ
jgi:F-type H+-transporting ATPase subunit epsilon